MHGLSQKVKERHVFDIDFMTLKSCQVTSYFRFLISASLSLKQIGFSQSLFLLIKAHCHILLKQVFITLHCISFVIRLSPFFIVIRLVAWTNVTTVYVYSCMSWSKFVLPKKCPKLQIKKTSITLIVLSETCKKWININFHVKSRKYYLNFAQNFLIFMQVYKVF